nr:MAG TPA: Scaffolding protein D/Capsid Protein F/Major, Cryo Electron Microscopy, Procapsid.0A [Caudoviricetes sp.]
MTEFSRFNDSEGYFCLYKNKPLWCYPVRSPINPIDRI